MLTASSTCVVLASLVPGRPRRLWQRSVTATALEIATFVAILVAAVFAGGCDRSAASLTPTTQPASNASSPGGDPRRPTPVVVRLGDAHAASSELTVEVVGTLAALHDVTVSAKVPGRLTRLPVDVGDRVHPGGVVAVVEETDFRLALQQRQFALEQVLAELGLDTVPTSDVDLTTVPAVARARAEAENAARRFERIRVLFERPSPLVAEQEFRDRQTEVEVARRNLASAEHTARALVAAARTRAAERDAAARRLADCTLRAPEAEVLATGADAVATRSDASGDFAVAERFLSVGEYVREGERVVRLVWDRTLRFQAAVPERFVSRVATGQTVHLRAEGVGETVSCVVTRVAPAIDPVTRTFQLEATVANPRLTLKPGGFARGSVVVGMRNDVRAVPTASVASFAGLDRVFSVRDGRAVEHVVRVLERRDDQAVIEGLPESVRQVVVSNAARLARDVPVEVAP